MKKLVDDLKRRYANGLEWIRMGEALPRMMYIACTISVSLILLKIEPGSASTCIAILGINLILTYIFGYMNNEYYNYYKHRTAKSFIFMVIEVILVMIMSKYIGIWMALSVLILPIGIAYIMIPIEEELGRVEDVYCIMKAKNIKALWISLGVMLMSSLLPAIIIAISLIFLEWNIFVKIAIVLGYIFSTSLISWADSNGLSIFGAMVFEW